MFTKLQPAVKNIDQFLSTPVSITMWLSQTAGNIVKPLQLFLTLNTIAAAGLNSFFGILCLLKLGCGGGEKNSQARIPKKLCSHAAAMIFSIKNNCSRFTIFPAVWESWEFGSFTIRLSVKFRTKWFNRGLAAMHQSHVSQKNENPPKPQIRPSLEADSLLK